jgi:Flp pilus assembly protein TadD
MGFVLALAGASCALAGALALLAAQQDLVPSVPTVEVRGHEDEPPPAPLLASALEAFEARRYTAAEQLLLQAGKSEPPDPRVQRLLALSLSKLGGRDREARDALARYRSLRAGGVEN